MNTKEEPLKSRSLDRPSEQSTTKLTKSSSDIQSYRINKLSTEEKKDQRKKDMQVCCSQKEPVKSVQPITSNSWAWEVGTVLQQSKTTNAVQYIEFIIIQFDSLLTYNYQIYSKSFICLCAERKISYLI